MKGSLILAAVIALAGAAPPTSAQTLPHVWIDAELPTSVDYEVVPRPNGWYHFLRNNPIGPDRDIPIDGQGHLWISGTMAYTGSRSIGTRAFPSTGTGSDRVEVRGVHGNDVFALRNATTRYFGYAFMIHPQMDPPTDWIHVMQVWQRPTGEIPANGRVPFTVSMNRNFRLEARARTHLEGEAMWLSDPIEKGKWHTLVYELRPSYNGDGRGGMIAIWLDGVEVARRDGDWGNPPSLGYTETFDVRVGIYRGAQNTDAIIMYDDILFATTREDATP